jgi:hypothetical protein
MGRPGQCLDGCRVFAEFAQVPSHPGVPHQHHIVVASGGQQSVVPGPLQAAYFLAVSAEPQAGLSLPDVPEDHLAVFAARSDLVSADGHIENAHPPQMVFASGDFLPLFGVDDSDSTSLLSDDQALAPLEAGNVAFDQFLGIAAFGGPDIGGIVKNNTDDIILAPVQKGGIEIVFESGGVENLIGGFWELACLRGRFDLFGGQIGVKVKITSSDDFGFVRGLEAGLEGGGEH